jgi:glycosyltransferase involved in cell wall biosynthesis
MPFNLSPDARGNYFVQDLTITILIPTRNEVEKLPQHLKLLAPLLSEVAEVIAVDSESSDGTRELLDQALAPLANARVINQPKGLYQAWNHGIQQASGKYIYVATVGDVLLPGGLEHLLTVAEQTSADVVMSPPAMRAKSGLGSLKWPIHYLLEAAPEAGILTLDGLTKLILCYGFLPGQGILGSSASNLYRRAFLVENPFPTDQGHGGDTIWGCRNAPAANMVVTRRPCAEFLFELRDTVYDSPDQILIYRGVIEEIRDELHRQRSTVYDSQKLQVITFLLGRSETNLFLAESLRVQKQQFEYIGDLKADLDRRGVLIEQLDEECRRLNGLVHQAPQPAKPRGLQQRIARWLDPS